MNMSVSSCFNRAVIAGVFAVMCLSARSADEPSAVRGAGFGPAKPVWAKGLATEQNLTLDFVRVFEWKAGDGAVELKIAAATVYRVFLNGEFIFWGPERTVYGSAKVDTVALVPREGRNTLVIEVGGYNCTSYQYSGDESFLTAELCAGTEIIAATPKDFTAVEAPRTRTGPVYSRQRGFIREDYSVDAGWSAFLRTGSTAKPPLALEIVKEPKYMTRASARPRFKIVSFADGKLPTIDSGFVGLRFCCVTPGRIAVAFDEALVNGRVDPERNGDPLRSWHAMLNRVEWKVGEPGEYTVETMEPYTMKYLRVETPEGEFADVRPYLRECRNPGADRVKFTCADPEIERLFAAARNSLAQNAVDIFTDCPSRERVGWLCDTYFTAEAAAYMTGDFSTEQEYLLNFVRTDDFGKNIPAGAIPGFMPSRSGGVMPTYMMWYILQCVQAAERLAGDRRSGFRDAVRARIEGIFDYLAGFEKDGLLSDLPGWVFIEWSKANDYVKGVNYPANMLYAAALGRAGALYGRADWLEKGGHLREKVLSASFRDGRFHDQDISSATTEVAQYYAFFTGLATPASHPDLWKSVVNDFGPERELPAGLDSADAFIGWMLRLEVLRRYGEYAEMFRSMKLFYGKMAAESGTLWEFADGHDSRCHAFGSNIAALILKSVFGIDRIDWANRKVYLRPIADDIGDASAEIPLPGGESIRARTADGERCIDIPDGWQKCCR